VLMNLCVNARDAMPQGGRLLIRALNAHVSESLARGNPGARPGPHVLIVVEDTGSGIPPEIIDRIFDPFFTTKAPGKGTGLGLATTLGIVRDHGGFVQVQSEVGKGTIFSLYFPAVEGERPGSSHPISELPAGRGQTILVIDDETTVREMVRTVLEAFGYRALLADNGLNGVALYMQHRSEIGAVVVDMMMPTMSGAEVISQLRTINPEVSIVIMSGLPDDRSKASAESSTLTFLHKPMTGTALLQALQRVLG
jgi:two-component system cell cycle sensor histidine kinase/response regulator CckA